MVGWYYRLDGHEFEQAMGVVDGQGSLACCSPWGHKELDMTEWLNIILNVHGEKLKEFLLRSVTRHECPLTLFPKIETLSLSYHTRKGNKRNPSWKGRSKTITDYRKHDTIYRKSERCHQKTVRINEFHKVTGYKIYTEIYCVSIRWQQAIRKRNSENNFIYNYIKKQ